MCISELRRCIGRSRSGELFAARRITFIDSLIRSLCTPLAADRVDKGAHVHYISVGEHGPGLSRFEAVPARVLATHKEVGAEPYYSIEVTAALYSPADGSSSRELQTEWHK